MFEQIVELFMLLGNHICRYGECWKGGKMKS
jgi:hypothetical protein